jgi:predicted RNA-binding protein with PIN domain
MLILIDGYNLIYALQYEGESLSKEELINKINLYQKRKKHNIILVFDGGIYSGPSDREEKAGNIKVIHTSKLKTADDKIKELSDKYRNGCVVITSDWDIKNYVKRNGSPTMDSEEFIGRLLRTFDNEDEFKSKKLHRKQKNMLRKI